MADSGDPSLTSTLVTLGAIAGFLWGGTAGSEDPALGFWTGAITGMILGMAGGWIVGRVLSAALQVIAILLELALIGLRIYLRFSAIGY